MNRCRKLRTAHMPKPQVNGGARHDVRTPEHGLRSLGYVPRPRVRGGSHRASGHRAAGESGSRGYRHRATSGEGEEDAGDSHIGGYDIGREGESHGGLTGVL
jgi:hypothetical protein